MTDTTSVLGYAWPLVVTPGENIAFHLSSATLASADAAVVRVRCADPDPAGPGLRLTVPGSAVDGPVALAEQPLHPGSYAIVPDCPVLVAFQSFTVGAFVWPTRPGEGAQTVLARWTGADGRGWRLGLDADGHAEFVLGTGGRSWRVAAPRPLLPREWVLLGGAWDATAGRLRLIVRSLDPQAGRDRSCVLDAEGPRDISWPTATPLTIAAHWRQTGAEPLGAGHYDGKIDRPRLYAAALGADGLHQLCEALAPRPGDPALVAAWDFSDGIPTERGRDLSANRLDATLRQTPTRGMTGANWNGQTERWTEAPGQYGAIHFHSDDMADAGWRPTLRLTVPGDWRSGFYALRLSARVGTADPVESYVSFFVRAPLGKPRARLAFVASTATFIAYIQEHREVGLSTYDTHSDGSGWCISSAQRPILSMRPRGAVFNYGNDTHLIDWLEQIGQDYDNIADDDIHRHGAQLMRDYTCVITGSHPEYISREMLNAFDAYQRGGGRHMYLGGNGFY